MKINHITLLFLLFWVAQSSAFGQKVDLKWKIEKDKPLVYTTHNKVLKNDQSGVFDGLIQMMSDSTIQNSDSIKTLDSKLQKFVETLYGDTENLQQLSVMNLRSDGLIDIKLILDDFSEKKNESDTTSKNPFLRMGRGIQLRGLINENGGIESFYTKWDQRNILSLLFELPTEKVNVGDQWELTVGWIQMDHNFKIDSSYRINQVTLSDFKKVGGNQVAVLKYNMKEGVFGTLINPMARKNVPTTMKMGFEGVAEFSITEGKWVKFSGILSYDATGWQNSSTRQAYVLSELKDIPPGLNQYE